MFHVYTVSHMYVYSKAYGFIQTALKGSPHNMQPFIYSVLKYQRSPGSIERATLYGLTFQCLDGHHLPVAVIRTYPLSYGFEHTAKLTLSCG